MTQLQDLLHNRILLLDGAMGTALQEKQLTPKDFGGPELDGCNEHLVLTRPDVIKSVHEAYLAAGADIVETNTFGSTPLVLSEYNISHLADKINTTAVQLARAACDRISTPEKPRFVAGSMGPTTKSLSVTGGITFDELSHEFYIQAKALTAAGADFLLMETALDTLNIKAGYCGIIRAFDELACTIPIAISGTIETMGSMLAGQGVDALYASIEHMNPLYIGLNCATGPEFMRDHIRSLAAISRFPIAVVPNAGIPDENGNYPESPEDLAHTLSSFVDEGWVNILGGCCGTTENHIHRLSELISSSTPRTPITRVESRLSGIDHLQLDDDGRPFIVGERSNVIGSRAFKRLIENESFDEAAEIARKQVKAGAHIIDVCLSNPDRDEISDIDAFLSKASRMVKVPFMIDSQVPEVVETAFKLVQGKCILNSINLEEGERYFKELLPIVKRYGAAVVVGCIRGEMAVTAKDKLDVAIESHRLLTEAYGINEEDIIFDPLVFPCGTGDENYFGSGKETIDGVRLIKERFPRCKTTLGISNVSFGLPNAGREVLNSVFLYHCTKAGLDTAIVNSEKLMRFSQITDEEKALCDDLLWYRTNDGNDPVANFTAFYRDKKHEDTSSAIDRSTLSLDEKFELNIVGGTKEFLIENLDEALQTLPPLSIINGPLMRAMDIVGKLFNDNELIVAEVLQSAEVMKTAVSYLEPRMEKTESNVRGTLLLATVKGDVHDIGKNLVEIILGNNGYKVIDLGIKCPPETLIDAQKKYQADFIGLSGLLVKSAQQMVITAEDLKRAGIDVPILVGGAALTDNFTAVKIANAYDGPVIYCKDAMNGLDVCNKLIRTETRTQFLEELNIHQQTLIERSPAKKAARPLTDPFIFDPSIVTAVTPHFDPVIVEEDLETIWPYINPQMMFGNHLGLKGNVRTLLAEDDEKAVKLDRLLQRLKQRIIDERLLIGKAVYQFFKVRRSGERLIILDSDTESEQTSFLFPRQTGGKQLCLTDFVNPDAIDTVCMFAVTCGDGVSALAKEFLDAGDYFQSHGLSAIALEAAEGFAELIHQRVRSAWGIPDDPATTPPDLFKLNYIGKRFSFGYPACPNLDDQEIMWDVLKPEARIGITLSDDCMMEPEASVSALVFHYPKAVYFST